MYLFKKIYWWRLFWVFSLIWIVLPNQEIHTQPVSSNKYNRSTFVNSRPIYHNQPFNRLEFCGEKIPLERLDVQEDFERDFLINVNDRTQVAMYIKRSGRFFPYVEKRLAEEGLPDDLKYIMVIESGMLNVTSSAGAAGIWQIMPTLAREYGLEVNRVVDERYNFRRATNVAILYLKRAYKKFKKWTLASAAYNMGISGLSRALAKQKKKNYFAVWLNRETRRYIFRIIAVKYIFENLHEYGYTDVIPYRPIAVRRIKLVRPIKNLIVWAKKRRVSYKLLRRLNPWIKRPYLNTPKNKFGSYVLSIPRT